MAGFDYGALSAPTTRERAEVRRLNAEKEAVRRTGKPLSDDHRAAITAGTNAMSPQERSARVQRANRSRGLQIFATKLDAERARKQRRRARKLNAFIADVVAVEIFERDNYTCQLCGSPTDLDADPLSDWYPSLDHIVPISVGGTHEPANAQCATRPQCFRQRPARRGGSMRRHPGEVLTLPDGSTWEWTDGSTWEWTDFTDAQFAQLLWTVWQMRLLRLAKAAA